MVLAGNVVAEISVLTTVVVKDDRLVTVEGGRVVVMIVSDPDIDVVLIELPC